MSCLLEMKRDGDTVKGITAPTLHVHQLCSNIWSVYERVVEPSDTPPPLQRSFREMNGTGILREGEEGGGAGGGVCWCGEQADEQILSL